MGLWVTPADLGDYETSLYAAEACASASEVLWALSGRKFAGVTTTTERYACVGGARYLGASAGAYQPALLDGDMYNVPVDDFGDYEDSATGLSPLSRIRLRGRPVIEIHAVRTLGGAIIDPDTYYLADFSTVQAVSGAPWLPCDALVTYTYGARPPAMARAAARTLALEFAKLWAGEDCALPERVTTISRQGVSYTLLDNQDFIDEMRTGLYVVDLFLKTVNPDRAKKKSRVFSPDVARSRKPVARASVLAAGPLDLVIGSEGGERSTYLELIDAEWLYDAPAGWVLSLDVLNHQGTKTATLANGAELIPAGDHPAHGGGTHATDVLKVSADYRSVVAVLGTTDPGQLAVYATRPTIEDPDVNEVALVATGNLSIDLSSDAYMITPVPAPPAP